MFNQVDPGLDGGPALLAKIAASGCIRTKRDAEAFRDQLLASGLEGDLLPLFRAVLALLGDESALRLPEPQFSIAQKAFAGLKTWYIGNSECRCLRTYTGAVATNLESCPVHGQTKGALSGMRNLTGLLPQGTIPGSRSTP